MKSSYSYRSEVIESGVTHYHLYLEDQPLTHRQVHQLWLEEDSFALFYSKLILDAGYSGFCWETPAIRLKNLDEIHEFVVIQSNAHSNIIQNWGAFTEHFQSKKLATSFMNLGKNGRMVSPVPDTSFNGASIASFLKTASDKRLIALWRLVGKEVLGSITHSPIWLSTAGLGVSWLHIRIDTRPKYYRYMPYRESC